MDHLKIVEELSNAGVDYDARKELILADHLEGRLTHAESLLENVSGQDINEVMAEQRTTGQVTPSEDITFDGTASSVGTGTKIGLAALATLFTVGCAGGPALFNVDRLNKETGANPKAKLQSYVDASNPFMAWYTYSFAEQANYENLQSLTTILRNHTTKLVLGINKKPIFIAKDAEGKQLELGPEARKAAAWLEHSDTEASLPYLLESVVRPITGVQENSELPLYVVKDGKNQVSELWLDLIGESEKGDYLRITWGKKDDKGRFIAEVTAEDKLPEGAVLAVGDMTKKGSSAHSFNPETGAVVEVVSESDGIRYTRDTTYHIDLVQVLRADYGIQVDGDDAITIAECTMLNGGPEKKTYAFIGNQFVPIDQDVIERAQLNSYARTNNWEEVQKVYNTTENEARKKQIESLVASEVAEQGVAGMIEDTNVDLQYWYLNKNGDVIGVGASREEAAKVTMPIAKAWGYALLDGVKSATSAFLEYFKRQHNDSNDIPTQQQIRETVSSNPHAPLVEKGIGGIPLGDKADEAIGKDFKLADDKYEPHRVQTELRVQ
ncbi:hypothetical protein ACFLZB_03785 [Nanoarchaeota archaeon]